MFAFAIWDRRARRLFLARDRVGIKPLYYTTHDQGFAFASELRSLLLLPQLRRSVDMVALNHYPRSATSPARTRSLRASTSWPQATT